MIVKEPEKPIQVSVPCLGQEEAEAVIHVLRSGQYTSGPLVKDFESGFSDGFGASFGVAVNSGTATLHLSLLALGIGPGDEVIVPPITFFATISSVLMCGATPVFVDVDEFANIDPEAIRAAITSKTKAIIPVHLWGMPCQIEKIVEIAEEHQLLIIEDCAQAHGASIFGKYVGTFGKTGCFSFFATKNMTTIEGGIILTDDPDVVTQCRMLRSHGMSDRHTHEIVGYNYRMSEVNAAIGAIQFRKLPTLNEQRLINSYYLSQRIFPDIQFYRQIPSDVQCVYFWFPILCPDKETCNDLREHLNGHNIGYRFRYLETLDRQPAVAGKAVVHPLPQAERIAGSIIGLPNHPLLTQQELGRVVTAVNSFFGYTTKG